MKLAVSIILCSVVFLGMAAWTWNFCPDPLVDFGRELYIPWRLTHGEHLYSDLAHFNGPLSQYFNAMIFGLSGASLTTIKIANLIIAACVLAMIFVIAKTLCDEWAALSAGVCFSIFFAFNQTTVNANFNWLTPYSHELTHGIALSLAMLCCLWKASERDQYRWDCAAGFLFGLVLLTKAEVMLAAGCGAGAWIALMSWHQKRACITRMFAFSGVAAMVVLLAILALIPACGFAVAIEGVVGSWRYLGNQQLMQMPYFHWLNGSDDYLRSFTQIGIWLAIYAAAISVALILATRVPKRPTPISTIAILVAALTFICLYISWRSRWLTPGNFLRPLPVALLISLVLTCIRSDSWQRRTFVIAALCFSGILILKILWNAQTTHYGFALAMPGAMLSIILVQRELRDRLEIRSWIARAALLGTLAFPGYITLRLDERMLSLRSVSLGDGADRFSADAQRGVGLKLVLADLARLTTPSQTIAVMPEGLQLNFLARRKSPTRDFFWIPSALAMYGEDSMLRELKAHPADWIVLAHADASVYGTRWFGVDYAKAIRQWVDENYEPVRQYGAIPFTSDNFGVQLLQRKVNP